MIMKIKKNKGMNMKVIKMESSELRSLTEKLCIRDRVKIMTIRVIIN